MFYDVGAAWYWDNFRMYKKPELYEHKRFRDLAMGYGWGARINLGLFLLKWDMAWEYDGHSPSKPKYYVSLGADL
jgi:outer membrane translocation and assembly module TamA